MIRSAYSFSFNLKNKARNEKLLEEGVLLELSANNDTESSPGREETPLCSPDPAQRGTLELDDIYNTSADLAFRKQWESSIRLARKIMAENAAAASSHPLQGRTTRGSSGLSPERSGWSG